MRVAFANATAALEREGCDAAGYRLAGEGLDKLCAIHLWGRWRLVLAFPEVDVALVVDVGEHLDNDRSRDVYTTLVRRARRRSACRAERQTAVLRRERPAYRRRPA